MPQMQPLAATPSIGGNMSTGELACQGCVLLDFMETTAYNPKPKRTETRNQAKAKDFMGSTSSTSSTNSPSKSCKTS